MPADRVSRMRAQLSGWLSAFLRRAEALLQGVAEDAECVVPECTGLWSRRKPRFQPFWRGRRRDVRDATAALVVATAVAAVLVVVWRR